MKLREESRKVFFIWLTVPRVLVSLVKDNDHQKIDIEKNLYCLVNLKFFKRTKNA
jgi:hypothetical protein